MGVAFHVQRGHAAVRMQLPSAPRKNSSGSRRWCPVPPSCHHCPPCILGIMIDHRQTQTQLVDRSISQLIVPTLINPTGESRRRSSATAAFIFDCMSSSLTMSTKTVGGYAAGERGPHGRAAGKGMRSAAGAEARAAGTRRRSTGAGVRFLKAQRAAHPRGPSPAPRHPAPPPAPRRRRR